MDLSKWGVPVDEKSVAEENVQEELKRLRIIADMAAALTPELEILLIDKSSDYMARIIKEKEFNDFERRHNNLRIALKFAGYVPDKNGKMVKQETPVMKKIV